MKGKVAKLCFVKFTGAVYIGMHKPYKLKGGKTFI